MPTVLLMTAVLLIAVSMFVPYWAMTLQAPQYPRGLHVNVFVDHLDGDVPEIDELNHYLGLAPLDEGGRIERALALPALMVMMALLVARVFPLLFLADLWFILYRFGHSVDPTSALGGAVGPFTPPLFGEGHIGQFSSTATAGPGLFLCVSAGVVAILALWRIHAAYRMDPQFHVQDAQQRTGQVEARR
jgi:hypothetical protein